MNKFLGNIAARVILFVLLIIMAIIALFAPNFIVDTLESFGG